MIIKKAEVYKPSDLAMPIEKKEGSQLLATHSFIRKQAFKIIMTLDSSGFFLE